MSQANQQQSSGSARVPDHLRKPNHNHARWLFRRIWDRINRENEHFMGVLVGQEGSGKSYTALKIANEIDPSFTADRVIFDVEEMLRVLKDGNHEPGNFYVLDEAGASLGRRTWQDRGQVLANQALQLIRSHNLGLLFTLPRLSELDSQTQGRLQAFYEIVDKEDGEFVSGKWKFLDPDRADTTGKIYRKYPKRREDGITKRITRINLRPPADELIKPYEERKEQFQEEFYEKTIEKLSDGDTDSDTKEKLEPADVAEQILSGGLTAVTDTNGKTGEPYINKDLIRAEYEISHADARAAKSMVEKQTNLSELGE